MTFVGILVVILLLGLRIASHFSDKEALAESAPNWHHFAQRHGLSCEGLFVHGTFKGYSLAIDIHERRTGK